MPDSRGNMFHFGPGVADGAGLAAIHRQIHEAAVNKTIARVFLGELKLDEPFVAGGNGHTEYLLIEFTDGSTLHLEVNNGNSFFVGDEGAIKRARPG